MSSGEILPSRSILSLSTLSRMKASSLAMNGLALARSAGSGSGKG